MGNQLKVLSTVKIKKSEDLYKIVDTLNRTLKQKNLVFGLALDDKDPDMVVLTTYCT